MVSIPAIVRQIFGRDSTAALTKKQSDDARVGPLKREFAQHPTRDISPARLHQILEAAELGDLKAQSELFEDMEERDPQIGADTAKRRQLSAELEWQIVPPDNPSRKEKLAAEMAADVFGGIEVEDLVINLGAGIGHGWINLELPWALDGTTRIIEQPIFRPHAWFRLSQDDQDLITLRDNSINGATLWPLGWVQHRHRTKPGYVARSGLHRQLAWPYLFKHFSLSDLAELLEIYGLPARIGKYPSSASPTEKATLLRAVTSLGHNTAGIIPEGMSIDFSSAAGAAGSADMYKLMLDWCERAISKCILGGTLTSGTGDGTNTNALGNVHERGQSSLIRSDVRQYASTIKRYILYPMAAMNYGIEDIRRAPQIYLETDEAKDYTALSQSLPTFVDLGMKIPLWWAHEKTGIPAAADSEPCLQPRPVQNQVADFKTMFGAAKTAGPAPVAALRADSAQIAADHATDTLEPVRALIDPHQSAWIDQIRALADNVNTLEELRDRIITVYPDMPLDAYADAVAAASSIAMLTGMSDMQTEAGADATATTQGKG